MPLLALLIACNKDPVLQPDVLTLDFLAVDEGNDRLMRVDQLRGNSWSLDLPAGARDLTWAEPGVVIVSHERGAMRVAVEDGAVLWETAGWVEVLSAFAEPNDAATMAIQNGTEMVVVSVDRDGEQTSRTTFPDRRAVGTLRQTVDNHFLFAHGEPWQFDEVTNLGREIFGANLRKQGWQIERMGSGNYIISTTDELRVTEIGRDRATVRTWDAASAAGTYNLVSLNGWSYVDDWMLVANRLAVTGDNDGAHAIAFDPEGAVAWSWTDPDVESVPSVLLLEVHVP
jgi:hypothetical protein